MVAAYAIALAALCVLAVRKWGVKALYALVLISYVQNTVLPFVYTTGLGGADLVEALILLKELLLFALFAYSAWRLLGRGIHISTPLDILIFFTIWCALRGSIGLMMGDDLAYGARLIRTVCFPLQAFVIGLEVAYQGVLEEKFLRWLRYTISVLGVATVIILATTGTNFWVKYANVASYNIEIKGEPPGVQNEDMGTSGTSTAREQFSSVLDFRASGTFGDPISMSFTMALGILLAFAYRGDNPGRWARWLAVPMFVAIFLGFTRSSWIFLTTALAVLLIRKRRYGLLATILLTVVLAVWLVPPLSAFYADTMSQFDNPNNQHAAGLRDFYTHAFSDAGNILGKGLNEDVQTIPESGYAFLLEHLGAPAYIGFLAFHLVLFLSLFHVPEKKRDLALIAQGMIVGTLITMHTSYYAFGFIYYLPIWWIYGYVNYYAQPRGAIQSSAELLPASA